jgi:hypothetical protein
VATAAEHAGAIAQADRSMPQITHATLHSAHLNPDRTTRTTVGVGEVVAFNADQSGTWSCDSGAFQPFAPGFGDLWKAPERAASATVAFTGSGGSTSQPMSVIEPTDLTATRALRTPSGNTAADNDFGYADNEQGTNMWLTFQVLPLHVSFGYIQIAEASGSASGVAGYFADFDYVQGRPRPPGSAVPGAPDETAQATAREPRLYHTARRQNDDGFCNVSALKNESDPADEVLFTGFDPPYSPGEFHWLIPNSFRVPPFQSPGATTGAATPASSKELVTTKQSMFLVGTKGKSKVEKLGQTCSRTPPKP